MKRFLWKIAFLALMILAILSGTAFVQKDEVWTITNAIGMDAKLFYGRKMDAEELDVIAIGSSMTLNNLNSEVFQEAMEAKARYFNYSAWGLTIEDSKIILENLLQTSEPSSVVMFSNIVDFFDDSESRYAGKDLRDYMDHAAWKDILLAVKYGFPHNLESIKSYDFYKQQEDDYTSLCFDSYGGVPLKVYRDKINGKRWDIILKEDTVKEKQYEELAELCELASKKEIRFYFVQTPCRRHYLGEDGAVYMEKHWERCRKIVEESGQYYYNATDFMKYDDSYFADYIHLNEEGSRLLTEEFVKYYVDCERKEAEWSE